MTKLHIHAHRLAIERGRYAGPLLPPHDTTCDTCPHDQVQDEYYFMVECTKHTNGHKTLYQELNMKCPNFTHINDTEKIIFIT